MVITMSQKMNENSSGYDPLGCSTAKSQLDFSVSSRVELISKHYDLTGKRILDYGCGNGIYTQEIAKKADWVLGIDIEEKRLQEAIKKYKQENLEFRNCGIEELEIDEKFDVVISIEVLEHVSNEDIVLEKIRDLLVDDGEIIFFVPNKLYPFETHGARIFGRNIHFRGSFPFLSWAPRFIRRFFVQERIYTKRRLKRLFLNHGFQVLEFDYWMPPLDKINSRIARFVRKILRIIERTPLKAFGISIFCVARKDDL